METNTNEHLEVYLGTTKKEQLKQLRNLKNLFARAFMAAVKEGATFGNSDNELENLQTMWLEADSKEYYIRKNID